MYIKVDIQRARELTSSLLLGANLDEIRFSGSYVLMRFISSNNVVGRNIYVDIEFYGLSDISGMGNPTEDFSLNRSLFLGGIYKCIGSDVEAVHLSEIGDLDIEIGGSHVELRTVGEAVDVDDFYWDLKVDIYDREFVGECISVSCVLTETGIAYFEKKSE